MTEDELIDAAFTFAESYDLAGEPIDWQSVLLDVEQTCDVNLPEDWDDPLIKRIKRGVRQKLRPLT